VKGLLWLRRMLTTGLTGVAFWNSYNHTAAWFSDHGQAEQSGWLALIPEVGVILVVLTLCTGKLGRVESAIVRAIGVGSVAITFTANLAGASAGPMGVTAALVAPVFAVLGFALEAVSLSAEIEPPQSPPQPARKKQMGKTDIGILWATERDEWPTTAQILEKFPDISVTTARKIHNSKNLVSV